jgi:prepilin-type N-terminal cleavage/methylation domain-containing protein
VSDVLDRSDRGFSFVEVLIALTIVLAAAAPLLHVAASGQRLSRSHGEAIDLHQRLRVAVEKLRGDLTLAGAGERPGPVSGLSGNLTGYLSPLVPARLGARAPDAPLSAFSDRVSLVFATDVAGPSALTVDMSSASDAVGISATATGCPAAGLCGFTAGTRALVLDTSGVGAGHDFFTVTGTAGALAHDAPNPLFHRPYAAARSLVVPVVQRVYYFDRPGRRLMVYDGYQSDMPFIDNVVDVRFEYFADRMASSVTQPPEGMGSCVFDAGMPPVPRLADLGGDGLHPLTVDEMTDGPVCGAGPNAFDGDLLRIRLVRVTLRLQAGADEVRARGSLFSQPGRSSSAYSYVPDFEVTFDVAPRNMAPAVFPR